MCVYILDNYSCKVAPLKSGMGKNKDLEIGTVWEI